MSPSTKQEGHKHQQACTAASPAMVPKELRKPIYDDEDVHTWLQAFAAHHDGIHCLK